MASWWVEPACRRRPSCRLSSSIPSGSVPGLLCLPARTIVFARFGASSIVVLIIPVLWLLFGLSALLLIVVVLLQEPKGGGLAEAFGGMGAQTFGVKSGGINRFTFIVFTVFILSATLIHVLRKTGG
ncbi:MAG: preprotein translocase subunit SecG [Planctomycetes bacterium]|nr:preprotein translocase subunit SecG [Planctomycetota bacterium]